MAALVVLTPAELSANEDLPLSSLWGKRRTSRASAKASASAASAKPPVKASAPAAPAKPRRQRKASVSAVSAKPPVPTSSPSRKGKTETLDLVPVTQAAEDEDRSVRIVRKVNKTLKLSEDQVALYKYFRRTYKGKRGRADLVHECRATGVSSRASRKTMCKRLAKNMSD